MELQLQADCIAVRRWAELLCKLSLPSLKRLHLGGSIAPAVVLDFLSRHRGLRSLTLSDATVPFIMPEFGRTFSFEAPELMFIQASCLYLGAILNHLSVNSKVSSIIVTSDFYSVSDSALRRKPMVALLKRVKDFRTITKIEICFSNLGSVDFFRVFQDGDTPEVHLLYMKTIILHQNVPLITNTILVCPQT